MAFTPEKERMDTATIKNIFLMLINLNSSDSFIFLEKLVGGKNNNINIRNTGSFSDRRKPASVEQDLLFFVVKIVQNFASSGGRT